MESVQAPRCPACGFTVFNRLYPKCEGCGAELPEAMRHGAAERAALLNDAEPAREREIAREREAAKAAAEQSALAVLAIVAAGH